MVRYSYRWEFEAFEGRAEMALAELKSTVVGGHEAFYHEAGVGRDKTVFVLPGWVGKDPLALVDELSDTFRVVMVRQPGYAPTPAIPGLKTLGDRVEWHLDFLRAIGLNPEKIASVSAANYIAEPLAKEFNAESLAQFEPIFRGVDDIRSFFLRWLMRKATRSREDGYAVLRRINSFISFIQGARHLPPERRHRVLEDIDPDTVLDLAQIVRYIKMGEDQIHGGLVVLAHKPSLIRHGFVNKLVEAKRVALERIRGTHLLPKEGQRQLGRVFAEHFSA